MHFFFSGEFVTMKIPLYILKFKLCYICGLNNYKLRNILKMTVSHVFVEEKNYMIKILSIQPSLELPSINSTSMPSQSK